MTSVASKVLLSVDQQNFDQTVLQSPSPVLVDFGAEWCGYCKPLTPILEAIAQDPSYRDRVKIVQMDIDHNPLIVQRYGIRGIPLMILFKDGQAIDPSLTGLKSEQEIRKFLNDHL